MKRDVCSTPSEPNPETLVEYPGSSRLRQRFGFRDAGELPRIRNASRYEMM